MQALLMTEEAHADTLKRGESTVPPSKNMPKQDGKGPSTAKATVGNLPSTKNSLGNGNKVEYAKPDIQHCQPTSSRTKVEDLVTNGDEEKTLREEQAHR